MTARQLYEGVLIELNKENAPNILLEDFNYFANKAINNYVNKRYNIYDINQQTTDDLRVLKATAMLKPKKVPDYIGLTMAGDDRMATYEVVMPTDYLHILNCICVYKVNKTYKCYNAGDTWRSPATRLTADMYSLVLDNFWNKPTYKRPYYYIHNVNTSNTIPTNPYGARNFKLVLTKPKPLEADKFYTIGNSKILYFYSKTTKEFYYFLHTNPLGIKLIYDDNKIKESQGPITTVDPNSTRGATYAITGRQPGESQDNDVISFLGDKKPNITPLKIGLQINVINIETLNVSNDGIFIATLSDEVVSLDLGTDSEKLSFNDELTGSDFDKPNDGIGPEYGEDAWGNKIAQGEGLPRTIEVFDENGHHSISNIERGQALRYGNVSLVRLEIRYGTDTSVFELTDVYVDYIKAPQNIRLTQKEIDLTEDTSQMLEYPDYVCQEIINELVHLVMENISDLRLLTHPVVTLSIANPTQQLTQPAAQAAQ